MRQADSIFSSLRQRWPLRTEILAVFSVVLFAVYGWSIRGFLFKVPSFMLYFGLGEIIAILFYMMAFALLESLLVTAGLVLASFVLPSKWLRQGFAYKGFLVVLVATLASILFQGYYKIEFLKELVINGKTSLLYPILWGLMLSVLALVGLVHLFQRLPRPRKYLFMLVERFNVFLYIYVPLGIAGILVILIRNLL